MSVNVYYDPATLAKATGTARQWRVQLTVERVDDRTGEKTTTEVDALFPDYLSTLVGQGYITADELRDKLGELVLWAARKRLGIE